jgi:hypothetical protein
VTRYISLAEYFWLAEQVTGVEAAVLVKAARPRDRHHRSMWAAGFRIGLGRASSCAALKTFLTRRNQELSAAFACGRAQR